MTDVSPHFSSHVVRDVVCLQCASLLLRGKGVEMGAINPPLSAPPPSSLPFPLANARRERRPPSKGSSTVAAKRTKKEKKLALHLLHLSFPPPSSSSYHAGGEGGRSSFRFSLEVGEGGRGGFLTYLSHGTKFPSTFVSRVLFRPLLLLLLLLLQVVSMSGAPFSRSNPSRLSSEGKGQNSL